MKAVKNNIETETQNWELIRSLVEDCYPRLTGTDSIKRAELLITTIFNHFCDDIFKQDFNHRPSGFLKFIPYLVISHVFAVLLLVLDFRSQASLLFLLNLSLFLSQLFFYKGWVNRFFPEKYGTNIIGTIEPTDEVHQNVVFSGHYDAPYVFELLQRFPRIYTKLLFTVILSILIAALGSVYLLIQNLTTSSIDTWTSQILLIPLTIMLPAVLLFFFFTSSEVSPGAGDDAIAIGIINAVGQHLGQERLKHTRIVLLALDGEEAGLNGARAFSRQSAEFLGPLPSYNINIDSIFKLNDIKILTRDLNSLQRLSKIEALVVQQLSKELGHELPLSTMPIGGGSTDSAELVKSMDSVALVGVDASNIESSGYHTLRDDMSAISKESFSFLISLLIQYAIHKDESVIRL